MNEILENMRKEPCGFGNGHFEIMICDVAPRLYGYVMERLVIAEKNANPCIKDLRESVQKNRNICLRFSTQEKCTTCIPSYLFCVSDKIDRTGDFSKIKCYFVNSWDSAINGIGIAVANPEAVANGNYFNRLPLFGPNKPFTAHLAEFNLYCDGEEDRVDVDIILRDNSSKEPFTVGGGGIPKEEADDLYVLGTGEFTEPLFWMSRNERGCFETGVLMTKEQVMSETDVSKEDLNGLLELPEKYAVINGEFRGTDTYTIMKVEKADTLYDLLTWRDYDFTEGFAAVDLDEPYPEYVDESLRINFCVYAETGETAQVLPSGKTNETFVKYAIDFLGVPLEDLRYNYSPLEKAQIAISQMVQNATITSEAYVDILNKYGLKNQKEDFFSLVDKIFNKTSVCL